MAETKKKSIPKNIDPETIVNMRMAEAARKQRESGSKKQTTTKKK